MRHNTGRNILRTTGMRRAVVCALAALIGTGFLNTSTAQAAPRNDRPAIDGLWNAGFECTPERPGARHGGFADVLQAEGSDPDPADAARLTYTFALWTIGDRSARQEFPGRNSSDNAVSTADLPSGTLVDGVSYGWQARVSDGRKSSAWSRKCYFTYDGTNPAAPVVTSVSPTAGELIEFTFSAQGDTDVAGYQFAFDRLPLQACDRNPGGLLVCADPLAGDGRVRVPAAGADVTVRLNAATSGRARLVVRAVDRAGNLSAPVEHLVWVPSSAPVVTVLNGDPRWNEDVVLKAEPREGFTGVREYTFTYGDNEPVIVPADENGAATFTFRADDPWQLSVGVSSRSANGFISDTYNWTHIFDPSPRVTTQVAPAGQESTFTFSPPPGPYEVAEYSWRIVGETSQTTVAAGADGTATVTWTAAEPGTYSVVVRARDADGQTLGDTALVDFEVPAAR